jgi:uncharacterized membrane protein
MPPVTSRPSPNRSTRRSLAWSLALLSLAFGLLVALVAGLPHADAQSTGGSFGGGDWGGGGGGGGGSYGGGSSSSDNDGSAFFLIELVFIAFRIHPLFGVLVLVIGVGVLIARGAASRNAGGTRTLTSNDSSWSGPTAQPLIIAPAIPAAGSRAWMNADVTQVRIALDMSARPAIEQALNSLMHSVDVRSRHGLLLVVHRVAGLLRQNERAWRLAGETNYHPMSPPQASGVFSQLASSGRARAATAVGHSADPNGVFFITLLVAAKREIVDFQAHRPEQLRMILDDLARITEHDLVAAECYWLPLASGTGMSVDEVRRLHPDIKYVEHAASGAASAFVPQGPAHGGAAPFCPHCGKQRLQRGPTCEHCGAGD